MEPLNSFSVIIRKIPAINLLFLAATCSSKIVRRDEEERRLFDMMCRLVDHLPLFRKYFPLCLQELHLRIWCHYQEDNIIFNDFYANTCKNVMMY